MLAFFRNSSLTEFRSSFLFYLSFFCTVWVVLNGISLQKQPVVPQFWCSSRFYFYQTVTTFLNILSVILLCWWQYTTLKLFLGFWFVLESDQQETLDLSRKWIVDFNAGEPDLTVQVNCCYMEMDGSVLDEKWSFNKILKLSYSSKLDLDKHTQENWILDSLQPSTEYCCHVWAGAPIATWICWMSYRIRYLGLLVLHLLHLLNTWLNVEMQPV